MRNINHLHFYLFFYSSFSLDLRRSSSSIDCKFLYFLNTFFSK